MGAQGGGVELLTVVTREYLGHQGWPRERDRGREEGRGGGELLLCGWIHETTKYNRKWGLYVHRKTSNTQCSVSLYTSSMNKELLHKEYT